MALCAPPACLEVNEEADVHFERRVGLTASERLKKNENSSLRFGLDLGIWSRG